MNPKNSKKSPIHENADANITCDFGDGDISRSRSFLSNTYRRERTTTYPPTHPDDGQSRGLLKFISRFEHHYYYTDHLRLFLFIFSSHISLLMADANAIGPISFQSYYLLLTNALLLIKTFFFHNLFLHGRC